MNFELDEAKRKFFKNCRFIAKAPACIFLEGNRFSKKAKVLPVPRYVYAGIERGNYDAFRHEEHSDVSSKGEKEFLTVPWESMNEEERRMVKGETPISSLYSDRVFHYHLILNVKYKEALVWLEALKKTREDKGSANTNEKEVEKTYQRLLPKFKDYFKIKVWSDITSNIGLNENAAIAAAAGTAFFLEVKRSEESKTGTAKKLENIARNLKEQALTDEDFTGVFQYALALDFCSNGAAVFSSLMGMSAEQGALNYESLVYDELKEFYRPYSPSLLKEIDKCASEYFDKKEIKASRKEKLRSAEKHFKRLSEYSQYVKDKGVYAYWDRCLNLHPKVSKGIPLYRWSYSEPVQTKSNEPASLLIMKKEHFLDRDERTEHLADSGFKYYQISPVAFAVFSDPNTVALCESNPKRHVFGNENLESPFYYVYNSRKEGWCSEGLQVMDIKEIEKDKKEGEITEKQTEIIEEKFLTSYKLNLLQDKTGKGIMSVARGNMKCKINLSKNQIEICLAMAHASKKDRNKEIPDYLKGYCDYNNFRNKVEHWSESTTNYQIRTQIIPIRKKLLKKSLDPNFIENKPKVGYRFSTYPDNISFKSYYGHGK